MVKAVISVFYKVIEHMGNTVVLDIVVVAICVFYEFIEQTINR